MAQDFFLEGARKEKYACSEKKACSHCLFSLNMTKINDWNYLRVNIYLYEAYSIKHKSILFKANFYKTAFNLVKMQADFDWNTDIKCQLKYNMVKKWLFSFFLFDSQNLFLCLIVISCDSLSDCYLISLVVSGWNFKTF